MYFLPQLNCIDWIDPFCCHQVKHPCPTSTTVKCSLYWWTIRVSQWNADMKGGQVPGKLIWWWFIIWLQYEVSLWFYDRSLKIVFREWQFSLKSVGLVRFWGIVSQNEGFRTGVGMKYPLCVSSENLINKHAAFSSQDPGEERKKQTKTHIVCLETCRDLNVPHYH